MVRFHQTEGDEHFTYHSDGTHHQARKIKGRPRERRGQRSRPPIISIRGWEFVHGQVLFTGYKALCQPDSRNPSYQEIVVPETYHGPRAGICYETYIVSSLEVLAFKEAMTVKRGEKWEEPLIEIVPLQDFPQHSFAIVYNRTPALSSQLKGGTLALNGKVLGQELRPRYANPEGAA